jgi:hypothetical protein
MLVERMPEPAEGCDLSQVPGRGTYGKFVPGACPATAKQIRLANARTIQAGMVEEEVVASALTAEARVTW